MPSSPNITLNLIVLSHSIVKKRTLFPELKKKAEDILTCDPRLDVRCPLGGACGQRICAAFASTTMGPTPGAASVSLYWRPSRPPVNIAI